MANQSMANKTERKVPCPRHDLGSDGSPEGGQVFMVMRTFYTTPKLDNDIRRLAFQAGVTKNELIRTILMASRLGNCKKCAEDLEQWKTMACSQATKGKGKHRVLDDEVPRSISSMLDYEAGVSEMAKGAMRAERRRVNWFTKVIAELTLDYGKLLFQEKDFLIWLTSPHKELANQSPAAFVWRGGKAGSKKVKLLLDRFESGGFA